MKWRVSKISTVRPKQMKMIIALNSVRAIHSSNNQTKVEHILAKIPDKDVTRRSLGGGFKDVSYFFP